MFCWKLGICKSSHLSKSADWLRSWEDLDLSAGHVPSPESTQEEGLVSCQCFAEHALSLGLCVCFFPISQYMQVLFKNVLIFPRDLFRLLLEALADLFYSSINNLLPQATVRLSPPGGSQEPCPLLPAPSSPGTEVPAVPLVAIWTQITQKATRQPPDRSEHRLLSGSQEGTGDQASLPLKTAPQPIRGGRWDKGE